LQRLHSPQSFDFSHRLAIAPSARPATPRTPPPIAVTMDRRLPGFARSRVNKSNRTSFMVVSLQAPISSVFISSRAHERFMTPG
jgi:hypothetical protein